MTGTQASSSGGKQEFKDQRHPNGPVATTLSVSTTMTEKKFQAANEKGRPTADQFVLASFPLSLKKPHLPEKKSGTMAFLSPSGPCLSEVFFNSDHSQGGHDINALYYPTRQAKEPIPVRTACNSISRGLAQKAATEKAASSLLSGGTASVAQSLYNEKKELVMTYLLELSLIKKSGPSTQANTTSSVRAENKQVTEENVGEDADEATDEEYCQGYSTDVITDADPASDDEAFKVYCSGAYSHEECER